MGSMNTYFALLIISERFSRLVNASMELSLSLRLEFVIEYAEKVRFNQTLTIEAFLYLEDKIPSSLSLLAGKKIKNKDCKTIINSINEYLLVSFSMKNPVRPNKGTAINK